MKRCFSLLVALAAILVPLDLVLARGGGRGGRGGRGGYGAAAGAQPRTNPRRSKKDRTEMRQRAERENLAGLLRDAREDSA